MTELHIAVVDDDEAVRDSLKVFLEGDGRRITCYDRGEAFLSAVSGERPDFLFLDLKMPGLSGLDVLRRLGRPAPFPVVMISAHGEISVAVQAIKLGAVDFVEKPFSPETIDDVIATARAPLPDPAAACKTLLDALTDRERQIAHALNDGLTNKEIARNFDISPRTVEVHRARVFDKLGVRNIAGLVRLMAEP